VANGWDGPDPTQENEPGIDYELAVRYSVAADITITGIRVWSGLSESVVGRTGRIWSSGGVLLTSVAIGASLPAGWTTYDLTEPLLVDASDVIDVSYNTLRYYGAVAGSYPNASADGLVTSTAGRFNVTPGSFPDTPTASFYGVDIVYVEGHGGDLPPVIDSITADADELEVTATVAVTDESPATVTIRWNWGDGVEVLTGAGVLTAQHTYTEPGLYAVLAVATDDAGQRDSAATPVVVRNPGVGLDVDAAIGELAERCATIPGITAADKYGPQLRKVNPPHIFVTLPTEPIAYSQTYDPATGEVGATEMTAKIVVVLGKVHSRSAYEALAAYASITGTRSIKSVIDSGVYVHMDDPMVTFGNFDEYTIAGDEYLAAIFDVHLMR